MREYLMTLMAVALLGGMIGMIAPHGDLKKYLHLACGICLLCVIATPIASLLKNGIPSLDFLWEEQGSIESTDYDEIYKDALQQGNQASAENIIQIRIVEEFALPSDSLRVQVVFELKSDTQNSLYSMKEIRLTLSGEAIFADPRELSEFINREYSCSCVVIYE